ncbi:hypothetical protein DTO271D3_8961 [Paecilomyces variotii]|nr:hypothetical protein DTO271D3_8961 [Paecilomyces variotii]KAJ9363323.1 hypothetical protein DTO280E4_2731 [Paecilomyces variotii]KAJ9387539.1 hypothetical protein DTO063F5_3103 [Paecilomyces variotii]
MCGRYALGVRLAYIRQQLEEQGMQVDEAPDDDAVRETYNFAPGYHGVVYRADTPDYGGQEPEVADGLETAAEQEGEDGQGDEKEKTTNEEGSKKKKIHYKLQAMKWGLVPFWTKRQPDYGSMMRTINCRDDSLVEDRGMWTSMKRRKRCVVVCQGFYEWLKKGPGGKEKIPHFVKRKDGQLMYFAGLWDCVNYEGSDEKLYTYTIITTSSNSYLKFLHDRMPVILDPNSPEMKTWLDPTRTTWSKELQSILKPYQGELECYPVAKEVGKVGNNSPDFLIPINSKDNKKSIANFFANAEKGKPKDNEHPVKHVEDQTELKIVHDKDEQRVTQDDEWTEDNAPIPVTGIKREHPPDNEVKGTPRSSKTRKTDSSKSPDMKREASASPPNTSTTTTTTPGRKTRSTTKTHSAGKDETEKKAVDGSQRITNFFKK